MNRPSVHEEPLEAGEFEASLEAVTAALESRAQVQQARRRTRAVLVFAAAASVALVAALWRGSLEQRRDVAMIEASGVVSDVTSSQVHAMASGAPIEAGQRLKTGEGGALTLRFTEGTIVTVGARSELGIHGLGHHRNFELEQGHFEAQVAKLKGDETFVVETRRARVEVRGTQFSVDVVRPSASCLEGSVVVKVTEGLVAVTSGEVLSLVKPGETKELPCAAPPPTPIREPEVPAPPRRAVREDREDEVSPLSRMNSMYGAAMELKQQGQLEAAANAFRELRRVFPKSALDEAAAVEELRLLEKFHGARGPEAAREYLRDYPDGYGRDVAEGLLAP